MSPARVTQPAQLSARSRAALGELRSALDGAGFAPAQLEPVLRTRTLFAHQARRQPAAALRRAEWPLSIFVELLLAGRRVDLAALRRVLSERAIEGLAECGVLAVDGADVSASVAIEPLDDVLIVGDVPPLSEPELEYAPPVSPSSLQLARMTVRREVEQALDLGTGSGIQSVLAAAHSRRVLGVDVNPGALRLAALALELNGRTNVELREGSWFEPVDEDARFGLIVSNPPFLAAPDVTWRYAHSEHPAELSARLVRTAAERLAEGGIAHVMSAWGLREGEDWLTAPRGWIEGLACDALVFWFETASAVDYAAAEHRSLLATAPDEFDRRVEGWLEYLGRIGSDHIAYGLVVLRRRTGANWARGIPSAGPSGPAGAQVERMLAGGDALAAEPGRDDLLAAAYRPAPDLTFVQRWRPADGMPRDLVEARADAGVSVHLDPAVADAVTACDGEVTLGRLVDLVAEGLDRDPVSLGASAAAAARNLVAMGMLEPVRPRWRD